MTRRTGASIGSIVLLLAPPAPGALGQELTSGRDPFALEVEGAALPILVTETGLGGPGWAWLLEKAETAQYVAFGEQHGIDGLAELVGELASEVGFDALAIEAGPWITRRMNHAPAREVMASAPHSLAFDYDGDVGLIERFHATGQETIWGLDQSVTAIHPFTRLARESSSARGRRLTAGLSLKASLKFGEYLRQRHPADFAVLKAVLSDSESPEVPLILHALEISNRIYTTYRSGDRSEAARIREQYMIDRFEEYSAAWTALNESSPKVLLKMGGAHLIKGIGPNGVPTLGEHIHARAGAAGREALHVGIRGFSAEHSGLPLEGLFQEDVAAVVLPTAELEAVFERSAVSVANPDLAGFDVLVYLPSTAAASRTFVANAAQDFRDSMSRTLLFWFGPLLLLLLLSLGWLGLLAWSLIGQRAKPPGSLAGLTVVSLTSVVVVGLQIATFLSSAPGAGEPTTGWVPWSLAIVAAIAIGLGFLGTRSATQSRVSLAVMLLWSASLTWVTVAVFRWNLGGMLG